MTLAAFILLSFVCFIIFIFVRDFIRRIQHGFITFSKSPFDEIYPKARMLLIGDQVEQFQHTRNIHQELSGRSFRLWLFNCGMIFDCSKARDAEKILSSQTQISKGLAYKLLKDFLQTGVLSSDGPKWLKRRRILTPAFHFNILNQDHCQEFLKTLKDETAKKGGSMLNHLASGLTLDIICETAMGYKLKNDTASMEYRNGINSLGEVLAFRITRPWFHNDHMYNLTENGKNFRKALTTIQGFTKNVINIRRDDFHEEKLNSDPDMFHNEENVYLSKKKRYAMLDTLLKAEKNGEIDDAGIREEVDTFMFAGHDTTSVAITWIFFELAQRPEIQEKILEDFKENSSSDELTINDINNMRYLDCVVKECLRLHPPVPMIARTLTGELDMNGLTLKKGTIVRVNIFNICRDPEQFPDPDKFDPDRFLPENVAKRHPFAYIPFSAGPRNCIGQKFALLEIKTVLLEVLQKYTLLPVTRPEEIVFMMDMVLRTKDPVKIQFKCRD